MVNLILYTVVEKHELMEILQYQGIEIRSDR